MNDLFEKIPKGSILLWNVEEDKDLPKKKEMVRLLDTGLHVLQNTWSSPKLHPITCKAKKLPIANLIR